MTRLRFKLMALLIFLHLMSTQAFSADGEKVHFRKASANFQNEAGAVLDQFAKKYRSGDDCIILSGFDNKNETSKFYTLLGRGRVLATFKELSVRGIDANRMVSQPIGITEESSEYRNENKNNYVTINAAAAGSIPGCSSITKQIGKSPFPTKELKLSYNQGAAEHKNFDQRILNNFWAGGPHDGSERITIEGHSDGEGTSTYNLLLSKVRALYAYQTLVKAGIPGDLIELQYFGFAKPKDAAKTAYALSANRRVSITWSKADTAPLVLEKNKTDDNNTARTPGMWQPIIFFGYVTPPKSLKDDVKNAINYGLGLNVFISESAPVLDALEIRLGAQKHKSKHDDIAGEISINSVRFGGVKAFTDGMFKPSFHLGIDASSWKGKATQDSTQRSNADSGSMLSSYLKIGRPIWFTPHLSFEPQFEGEYYFTGASGLSLGFIVELGWRI